VSEEILKALTQLFAIFSKQDGGVKEEEREYVIRFFNQELDQDSIKEYLELYDKLVDYGGEKKEKQRTSMKDSVRILGLCRKINKTLTQRQKIVVLIKIMELVKADDEITETELGILDTVAEVFNFDKEEYEIIRQFVFYGNEGVAENFNTPTVIQAVREVPTEEDPNNRFLHSNVEGRLIFLKIKSVDMYFVKYIGGDELNLNGFIMNAHGAYIFSHGSTVKMPSGDALYYSDIITNFNPDFKATELSFIADHVGFNFPNGAIGLHDINIHEGPGRLIGIMGASGAGKTTLLNVLAGLETPSEGSIKINGIDTAKDKNKIQGVIGYVSQDDLLIEELTVYENLFYNAKLCFDDLSKEELHERVINILSSLGLEQRKDLRVGNVLEKTISGGQRKRLNIALELIREPALLFVDEPTSGLSSRDSENVIDLLKELSIKGKLIFVVIHQPSSDIYKMFDKMYIMDTGGFPVYYGNPVEGVMYFKEVTHQVDRIKGQCTNCGNVNPEQIFNIIEAQVVDEYGQLTNKRKVTPEQWNEHFEERFEVPVVKEVNTPPPNLLQIPNKIKQAMIFTLRDVKSKIGNTQYLAINLLEAPLLAFILAFIIKYTNAPTKDGYHYLFNDNLPVFVLMSIIVALFMGLSISAEEIIKDRKILRRESFLNLNRNSYLMSKMLILLFMSSVQTFSFVAVGNFILEIQGMTLNMWLILFSISFFANMVGLNVSSAFNSAVTVYILIPIILIPQMILSGLMFEFDKLNDSLSSKEKVPLIADIMASRWAFEAMTVDLAKNNLYENTYFNLDKKTSQANYVTAYVVPHLNELVKEIKGAESDEVRAEKMLIVQNIIEDQVAIEGYNTTSLDSLTTISNYSDATTLQIEQYIKALEGYNFQLYNKATQDKEKLINFLNEKDDYDISTYKDKYFNQSLSDLVRRVNVEDRTIIHNNNLIQRIDPIFNETYHTTNKLDYRTHFYAPTKPFFGAVFDTYWFNIFVIWFMSFGLYIALYFEWLAKLINALGNVQIKKSR
jgi:ABC-type multidrug transport system ATPase subunit/uncharacterized tellurite resistance protein B-like protein